jgi:CCR4-NOT transcription complex subunit 9
MSSSSDIEQYVHQLSNQATRENALLELSKKRENFPELAPYLWYSFGTIAALLQVSFDGCTSCRCCML